MATTSIWTTYSKALTWEEARTLARQWGDDLTTRLNFDHAWHTEYDYFDGRAWVGAINVNGEAIFVDGTAVRDRYPQGVYEYPPGFDSVSSPGFSLSINGLDGPEQYGYLEEHSLQFGVLGPVPDQFVWEISGLTITGSPYADWIQPADISGMSIDLGAGNDVISVEYDVMAPAYIRMGAGDDSFSDGLQVEGYFEVWDGEGADAVSTDEGTLHAALDGDDDWYEAAKIIYDGATAPIHVYDKLIGNAYYSVISGSEIGTDQFFTYELHLGRGDDIVEDAVPINLYTKGGNDLVEFGDYGWAAQAFVDGGDGNDTLIATVRGGRMVGGNGADVLALEDWLGVNKTEMTGGSGADTFRFGTVAQSNTSPTVINDFAADGAVQDTLDLTAFNLEASSAAEAISSGLLTFNRVKGYTYLTVEGGAEAGDLTLMLKGIFGTNIVDNIVI